MTELPLFSPLDPEWIRDPWPHFARLRAEAPILHLEDLHLWVISRYADCRALLFDPRLRSDSRSLGLEGPTPFGGALLERRPFLFLDPPDHTRLRQLASKAFTPRMVAALRPRIESLVDSLVGQVLEAGEIDMLRYFATPLPVMVIGELLGLPTADRSLLGDWSADLALSLEPDYLQSADEIARCRRSADEFATYLRTLMDVRRRRPGDDLLSSLVAVEEAGDTLTEDEVVSTVMLLALAGHETTAHLVAGSLHLLLRRPDVMALLRHDLGLLSTGVDEFARVLSPVQLTGRVVAEPIELDGSRLEPGSFVLLLLAAANADPAAFDRPDEVDVRRSPNPHLAFGFGPHHCLGATLARTEVEIALRALLQRAPDMALSDQEISFAPSFVVRKLESLPVRLRP